jgi:hypothetical protein
MKIAMYDPPSGWMCGFPRPYKPLPGESVADTLRRDGYPEKMDPNWAGDHCRFWDGEQEPRRYSIQSDGDHKYFVEVGMEGEFEAWVAAECAYEEVGYEGYDYEKNRIDGRFTFSDPRNE